MPVRNTACTLVFKMCMPKFNRTLRTVIKSILVANVNHGKLKFNEADYLMVQIRPKIFLKHSLKALFSSLWTLLCLKSFRSNAYLIVLPSHLSISLIFNVEDLTFYRCTFAYLSPFLQVPQVFPRLRYFQYLSCVLLRHQWSMMMKSY